MKLSKAFGMRLANLLLERKMTPYSLSIKSGVSKQCISNIMNEKYKSLKFDTVIKIADALDMELEEFVKTPLLKRENLDID